MLKINIIEKEELTKYNKIFSVHQLGQYIRRNYGVNNGWINNSSIHKGVQQFVEF